MSDETEVIAMMMPDADSVQSGARGSRMATLLLRSPDGQMSLRTVSTDSPLGQRALRTGCFRQGAPIFDPTTRQVLGYEMERVPSPLGALA